MADRFDSRSGVEYYSRSFGAIAQLGERYNGIVEVGGSIPPGSTIDQIESNVLLDDVDMLASLRRFRATSLAGSTTI